MTPSAADDSSDLAVRMGSRWALEGLRLRPGATPERIRQFEDRYGVMLPPDLRDYLELLDGMPEEDSDASLTSFWGLDRIRPIGEFHATVSGAPRAQDDFVLCDIFLNCFWYAIRLRGEGVGKVTRWNDEAPVVVARSFTDFAEAYLRDPDALGNGCGLPPIETPTLCPVHAEPMEEREVQERGRVRPPEPIEIFEATARLFPYSGVPYGHDSRPSHPPRTWVQPVCPRCTEERAIWLAERRQGPP